MLRRLTGRMSEFLSLEDIIAALSRKLRIPPGLDLVTAIEKIEQGLGLAPVGTYIERAYALERKVGRVTATVRRMCNGYFLAGSRGRYRTSYFPPQESGTALLNAPTS